MSESNATSENVDSVLYHCVGAFESAILFDRGLWIHLYSHRLTHLPSRCLSTERSQ